LTLLAAGECSILKLTDHKPLFGNKQPNRTGTHWIVFIKEDTE